MSSCILIPTRNRAEMASKLVDKLLMTGLPVFVCVPMGDIFLSAPAMYKPTAYERVFRVKDTITLIIEDKPGIGQARNTLVKTAHQSGYEFGLFVDDDCWLNYKKVEPFMRKFEKSERTWTGAWNSYYDLVGNPGISMVSMVFGLRLAAAKAVGNFDPHLWIQEDGDMIMRLILAFGPKTVGHSKALLFRHLHTRMSEGGNDHAYQDERAAEHSRYLNKKYGLEFTHPKGARVMINRKMWTRAAKRGEVRIPFKMETGR